MLPRDLGLKIITLACIFMVSFLVFVGMAHGEVVTTNPMVQRDLAIAEAYWKHTAPGPSCTALSVEVGPTNPGAIADAPISGCWIMINPALWESLTIMGAIADRMFCVVMVHEVGHTAMGLPDEGPPATITNANLEVWLVPGCNEVYESAEKAAIAKLNHKHYTHHRKDHHGQHAHH